MVAGSYVIAGSMMAESERSVNVREMYRRYRKKSTTTRCHVPVELASGDTRIAVATSIGTCRRIMAGIT
jgi:hypothetical protein